MGGISGWDLGPRWGYSTVCPSAVMVEPRVRSHGPFCAQLPQVLHSTAPTAFENMWGAIRRPHKVPPVSEVQRAGRGTPVCSQSVRSTGNNPGFLLASEAKGSLMGLSLPPCL